MSPQMQQNIGLLLLPVLDIQELIQSSLEENIMLELDELQLNQVADEASSFFEDILAILQFGPFTMH